MRLTDFSEEGEVQVHVAETTTERQKKAEVQSDPDSEEESEDSAEGSSTSDSSGHAWTSEAATEDMASDEETFHDVEEKIMKKGRRRHVRGGLMDIMECMVTEAKAKAARPKRQEPGDEEVLLPTWVFKPRKERSAAVH